MKNLNSPQYRNSITPTKFRKSKVYHQIPLNHLKMANNYIKVYDYEGTIIPRRIEKLYKSITVNNTESEDNQHEYREKESAKNAGDNEQLVQFIGWNGIETEKNNCFINEEKVNNNSESSENENEGLTAYSGMEPDFESDYSVEFTKGYDSDNYLQCEPAEKRNKPDDQQKETEACKNCRLKTIASISAAQAEKIQLRRQAIIDLEDGKLSLSMMEAPLWVIRKCIQNKIQVQQGWRRQKMATFLNERYEAEQTLLHTSVRRSKYDVTDLLLSFGANPEILYRGKTIAHTAVAINDLLLLRILKHHNCEFTARNGNGETPLMLAIVYENQECAKLIWSPTNINIDTHQGKTVLHYLAEYGLEDLATQICAKRIININQQDDSGDTALNVEVGFNRIDMIEILLLHGADARIKDSHGHTARAKPCSKRVQAIFEKWEQNHNGKSLLKTRRKEHQQYSREGNEKNIINIAEIPGIKKSKNKRKKERRRYTNNLSKTTYNSFS
ncbi:uncharacterized protein LOC132088333 [Daphnia carinata]|uniref:uncharacterized protein LOC132088333 n=1 Tax=Daphnia carinata TaxID=120202 RepID=UPI0028688FF0|nr:uncharacterized protein LOC132088333 [Daphnia carinata]